MRNFFTSESVTEGHPDKLCDYISDSILDSYLKEDKHARVACETIASKEEIYITGEISSSETEKLDLSTSKYFKTMCVEENDIVKKGGKILKYSDGTYLKADYDCLISSYSVPENGSKCTSSNYVEVKNMKTLQLNISVDETEINQIKKGQEVKIEISALDKSITGKITSVNQAGTYSNSGTTFSAVVEFENDCNAKIESFNRLKFMSVGSASKIEVILLMIL